MKQQDCTRKMPSLQNYVTSDGLLDLRHYPEETIDAIPETVTVLNIAHSKLQQLPPLPTGLKQLHCEHSWIMSLPDLPYGLTHLFCNGTSLLGLPELPPSLEHLEVGHTQINWLPSLPESLRVLICDHTFLEGALTNLPFELSLLDCSDTNIDWIDLPPHLNELRCRNTRMTLLPELPLSLEYLNCEDNDISELPELPPNLCFLWCSGTRLTRFPPLPRTLRGLECMCVPLLTYPDIPGSVVFTNWSPVDVLPRTQYETLQDYVARLRSFEEYRARERCRALKEEIVMKAFHPTKVEKWLHEGGHACLEMMFGY
jgi:Leucine-rich repeat (LRR) protein